MDDCVFYRPLGATDPREVLEDEDVLCFSPRLGLNCVRCYSLRTSQTMPSLLYNADGEIMWDWTNGSEADWSYPASLDGHIFRVADITSLLQVVSDWRTPNTVEAALATLVGALDRPLMAAHVQSSLVGVADNRTGSTHEGNRHGETHPHDLAELNRAYLAGKRIRLDSVKSDSVNAAHIETPLLLA